MVGKLREWARVLKRDVCALFLASRDPRVPWYAKALAIVVAGYAISPIDLIPDFIPVLGYIDDVLLLPLGIWLVIKLIPPLLMQELRDQATLLHNRPSSSIAAAVIITIWVLTAALTAWLTFQLFWANT